MAEVKVGQVWVDNDPRHTDHRNLEVLSIKGKYATCKSGVGRKSKIRLDRFKPTSTGYRLEGGVE